MMLTAEEEKIIKAYRSGGDINIYFMHVFTEYQAAKLFESIGFESGENKVVDKERLEKGLVWYKDSESTERVTAIACS